MARPYKVTIQLSTVIEASSAEEAERRVVATVVLGPVWYSNYTIEFGQPGSILPFELEDEVLSAVWNEEEEPRR